MPPTRTRPPRRPSNTPPPRDPIPGSDGHGPVVLIAMGIGIYLLTLWFGITVVGDTPGRSAIMAGVIVAIAATGYVVNHRTPSNRENEKK